MFLKEKWCLGSHLGEERFIRLCTWAISEQQYEKERAASVWTVNVRAIWHISVSGCVEKNKNKLHGENADENLSDVMKEASDSKLVSVVEFLIYKQV